MSTSNITEGFFSQSKTCVVDAVHPITGLGAYSNETQAQLETRYGPLERITLDEAVDRIEKAHLTLPILITEDEFERSLNVLPPENWGTADGVQVFQCMEKYSGRVTGTFAKRGDGRCFAWRDIAGTPRTELAKKVLALV